MIALGGCQKIDGSQNYISTGIQGRVYNIGSPAEPVGWTPPPLKTVCTIFILNAQKDTLKTAPTDSLGQYAIRLLAGTYYLNVKIKNFFGAGDLSGPYKVETGKITATKAYFDNGVRWFIRFLILDEPHISHCIYLPKANLWNPIINITI